eukprot:2673519-Pyramimonas_sp.AAC.1
MPPFLFLPASAVLLPLRCGGHLPRALLAFGLARRTGSPLAWAARLVSWAWAPDTCWLPPPGP